METRKKLGQNRLADSKPKRKLIFEPRAYVICAGYLSQVNRLNFLFSVSLHPQLSLNPAF